MVVRAATVGAAAAAVGTALSDRVTGVLNGELLGHDPEEPIVEGDVISLTSAEPDR
jgi:molybdopterin-guanine dinucleotide biosynthesis protein A